MDWAILKGCFGDTNVQVADIDGVVERHGWVLVLEHKGFGVPLKKGQEITYRALAAQGNAVIIFDSTIALWGKITVFWGKREEEYQGSLAKLRELVSAWWAMADETYWSDHYQAVEA